MDFSFGFRIPKKTIASSFFVVSMVCTAPLSAQSIPSISLQQAIANTLAQHPELTRYQYQQQVSQGNIEQAGVVERPTLTTEIENVLGTGDSAAFDNMQTTISIGWVMEQELANQRIQTAKVESQLVDASQAINALDLAASTANYFVDVLIKMEQLKLSELALYQAKQTLAMTQKRAAVGKALNIDSYRAEAEVVRQTLAVEDLHHELDTSRYRLFAQWQGDHRTQPVAGSLLTLPAPRSFGEAKAQLTNHPLLKQLATQQRVAESQKQLALIDAKPRWQFSAGVRYDNASDDAGLLLGASLPLGGRDRNRGSIRALSAQQDVWQAEADALQASFTTQLYLLFEKFNHSQHVIEGLSHQVIPTLEKALVSAQQAYQVGRFSYLELTALQQELMQARRDLIDAYQLTHLSNIEIERLLGSSLK